MIRRLPLLAILLAIAACRCGAEERVPSVDAGTPPIAPAGRTPASSVPRDDHPRDDHGLPSERGEVVLARVGDRAITVLDYLDDYERRRGADRLRFAMPAQRGALLELRLRDELLADEARRRGHADAAEVTAAREDAMRRVLVELLREVSPPSAPTEAELLALFAEEPERWLRPPRVRAEFVRGTREEATAALEHAREQPDPTRGMREWVQRTASATVASGQLGPFAHPATGWREAMPVPRAFAEAAHATPAGRLYPELVEADGAFWVVYPLEREPEIRITFEAARDELVQLHMERAHERMLARALPEARVSIDEEALAAVRRP